MHFDKAERAEKALELLAEWRRPDPRLLRQDRALPTQPLRRPPAQPCPAHHHPVPAGYDQRTRDYADRRRAQGRTDRGIKRCLKSYIARELYDASKPHHHPLDGP
jgi:hypothetical protein